MTMAPFVDLFHRCLQPHLDQLQDEAIADPSGQRFQEFGMRNRVEVTGQVAVDHLGMPAPDQPFDLPHGVDGAPSPAIPVLLRLQVGLEDRLQDHDRRHLRYAVLNARDTHSALPPYPDDLRDLSPSPIHIILSGISVSRSSKYAEETILTSS